jgi:hypothetical protein
MLEREGIGSCGRGCRGGRACHLSGAASTRQCYSIKYSKEVQTCAYALQHLGYVEGPGAT